MSYIIKNSSIVAKIEDRPAGDVLFSSVACGEAINAARDVNLVNAQRGKISNAAKWGRVYSNELDVPGAKEVNPGEWLVK